MFSSDRILTLDVGSSKVVLSEFNVKNSALPVLTKVAVRELDGNKGQDVNFATLAAEGTIKQLMAEAGMQPAPLLVTLSGQAVFTRFAKIPILGDKNSIETQVNQEVEQNLPFPVQDVVWDYQVLPSDDPTEADVLIVAVKKDLAEDVARCAESAGLQLSLIDSAALALYNSVRYNYADLDGCAMALDIGAKSTSLLFIEGGKFFVRSIPIGGNMITTEISKGLGISVEEAEQLKLEKGFVALGGTFAIQDDEVADKCSKIIRNVVTRLHMEINRSINFYRSQQGGSAPERILLTGGGSMTKMLNEFFSEKFGIPVDYMNPFANVAVDINNGIEITNEELFLLSNSVGMMLRKCVKCPVEIDLMPSTVIDARKFGKRIPFFVASGIAVVLMIFCWNQSANKQDAINQSRIQTITKQLNVLKSMQSELDAVNSEFVAYNEKSQYIAKFFAVRNTYAELIDVIANALEGGCWLKTFEIKDNELLLTISGYTDDIDELKTSEKSAGEVILDKLATSGKDKGIFSTEKDDFKVESEKSKGVIGEIELSIKLAKIPGQLSDVEGTTEEEE